MFPYWLKEQLISSENPYARIVKQRVFNRTGGTLTVGGIYQFDTFKSAAVESSVNSAGALQPAVLGTALWNDPTSGYSNIVAPGTRGDSGIDLTMWGGTFCVALTAALDNDPSDVLVVGEHATVKIIGATTAVYSVDSPFRVTTGQVYGTMLIAATAPVGKCIGRTTLTIYTEATTPAATAHTVFFNGFGFPC